jgi:uncharacterized membrane protein
MTTTKGAGMATVRESIDVDQPLQTVYNQWTQFEEFPSFMEGVEQVTQTDDTHLHWVAEIGGRRHEWDAEITEQVPDQRVAWISVDGTGTGGIVSFEPLDDDRTRVVVEMEYEPQGAVESVGSALGMDDRRVKGDLKRFKQVIEERGGETGAWRGEVHGGRQVPDATVGTQSRASDTELREEAL